MSLILLLFTARAQLSGTVSPEQRIQQIQYQRSVRVGPVDRKGIADSVVGWSLPATEIERLPALLSKALRADVQVSAAGMISINRSKLQSDKIKKEEGIALRKEIEGYIEKRQSTLAGASPGTSWERMKSVALSTTKDYLDYEYFQSLLPTSALITKILERFTDEDLERMSRSSSIFYSSLPGSPRKKFPFNTSDIIDDAYIASEKQFTDAWSHDKLPQKMEIYKSLFQKIDTGQPRYIWLDFLRVGRKLMVGLNLTDDNNVRTANAWFGGILEPEFSEVPAQVKLDREESASLRHLSPQTVSQLQQISSKLWSNHVSDFFSTKKRTFDPAAVVFDPATADPLSFGVQEAISDLAKSMGASGWVANCPDEMLEAFARSVDKKEYLDIPTFQKSLATIGQCNAEMDGGILVIQPIRPVLTELLRFPRPPIQQLAKAYNAKKGISISDAADFALRTAYHVNFGLSVLYQGPIYKSLRIYGSPDGQEADALGLAVLGAMQESFRLEALSGGHVNVPNAAIDWEGLLATNGITNLYRVQFDANAYVPDQPEYVMQPQAGVEPAIEAWTDTGDPVVRRVRKTPINVTETITNGFESYTAPVTWPVGEYIDNWWIEPAKLGRLQNELPRSRATVTAADLRDKYLYGFAYRTTLHVRLRFPSGRVSTDITYFVYNEPYTKALRFDQLPEAVSNAMLSGVKTGDSAIKPQKVGQR